MQEGDRQQLDRVVALVSDLFDADGSHTHAVTTILKETARAYSQPTGRRTGRLSRSRFSSAAATEQLPEEMNLSFATRIAQMRIPSA
jgi:hypothetical protein